MVFHESYIGQVIAASKRCMLTDESFSREFMRMMGVKQRYYKPWENMRNNHPIGI